MAQSLVLKCNGLITNPNTLTNDKVDGALAYADNIVIDKDNVAESRRGFQKYNQYLSLGGTNNYISKLFNYEDSMLVHYGGDTIALDDGAGTWTNYSGTYEDPASGYKLRSLEQNKNLYIATAEGIQKICATDDTWSDAGCPEALDGDASASGTSGWFTDETAVAYRMVWGVYDDNNNLILGSPSQRLILRNREGADIDVTLTFRIPDGITTSHFYQIYRSSLTETASGEPNDELQLVIQAKPSSAEITAKSFTVLDDVVDDLKGATLYTSPSQEGIANSNDQPPYCKDFTLFKDHVFFANTQTRQILSIDLLGASGDGFNIDDTITIDGVTYTGKAAEDTDNDEFLVTDGSYYGDTAGPALAIEYTARSLVKVINMSSNNTTVYAYYVSGYEDVPGKIVLKGRTLTTSAFTAISSNGDAWSPELPSAGTNDDNTSDNESKQHRVYISKQQQPEAVPFFSYLDVGSANEPIKRIIALRDSVFVFKDDGVFKITGETVANFRVTTFDNNVKLLAPESAVTFNNTVFCMTLQGVVSISESGVAVISRPIEQQLLKLIQYTYFNSTTFGISYESERKYILYCIAGENQRFPTQAYVYNSFTNAWSRWTMISTCGFINRADDKMYYGGKLPGYTDSWVHKERKTFTTEDYVDDDWGIYITAVGSTTSVTVNRTNDCVVGYWLRQYDVSEGTYSLAKITAINTTTKVLTLSPAQTWSADIVDPVTLYKPITCRMKWVANTAGNPGLIKHFREATLFFRQDTDATLDIGYETNFQPGYDSTEMTTVDTGDWGDFSWGTYPWGGLDDTFSQPIRLGIPRNKQRCLWISFSVEGANAFSSFSVGGISTQFEAVSERYQWTPGG